MSGKRDGADDSLPLTDDELNSFRLTAHRRMPTTGLGAHRRRRLGQALEFRDFRSYIPGDDIRTVDWCASLRSGKNDDWVVRTFEAEEQLTLIMSVDQRPSMHLPKGADKMRVARWLVRALVKIAAADKARLTLHGLFADPDEPVIQSQGAAAVAAAEEFVAAIGESYPKSAADWQRAPRLNAETLLAKLPPASALVIITDLYFDDADGGFRDLLVRAQAGYRQVLLVELDSWPAERAALEGSISKLQGVEDVPLQDDLVEPDPADLNAIENRINEHRKTLLDDVAGGGLVRSRWSWSDDETDLRDDFRARFFDFAAFQSLFARA